MSSNDWNFFEIAEDLGLPLRDIREAPQSCGFYFLFTEEGGFIYVGKAKNLNVRLAEHFSSSEENERIRTLAKYAIWWLTQSEEDAEKAEGVLFDAWVERNGQFPIANRVKPPASQISELKILTAELERLFSEASTLGKRLPRE